MRLRFSTDLHSAQDPSTHLIYLGDPEQVTLEDVAITLAALQDGSGSAAAIADRANTLLDEPNLIEAETLDPLPTADNANYVCEGSGAFNLADVAAILARLQVGTNPAFIASRINQLLDQPGSIKAADIRTIPGDAVPQGCPDPNSPLSVTRVVTGLFQPLYVTAPPGDTNRLFIVEQNTGQIRIFDLNRQVLRAEPFLTIPSVDLITPGFEQGLLGLAFHPDYATNGKFYVNYTAPGGGSFGRTKLVEYRVGLNPNVTNALSARILLTIDQPEQNHNGGWIGFGPDGYLYWATGDGGGTGFMTGVDNFSFNSQIITDNLLGKMLRLDVDRDDFPEDPIRNYGIPATNPFIDRTGDDEIWAYGLRNPWRASFDPATGDLYIADVGQADREEVNVQPASCPGGENYGWDIREGTIVRDPVDPGDLVPPTYELDRRGEIASITGGYVYRGPNLELDGTYFFAVFVLPPDLGNPRILSFKYTGSGITDLTDRSPDLKPAVGSIDSIASFGLDGSGNIYIVDLFDGEIYRIDIAEPPPAS